MFYATFTSFHILIKVIQDIDVIHILLIFCLKILIYLGGSTGYKRMRGRKLMYLYLGKRVWNNLLVQMCDNDY